MPSMLKATVTNRSSIEQLVTDINALPAGKQVLYFTPDFYYPHATLVLDEKHGTSVVVMVWPTRGKAAQVLIGPNDWRRLPASSPLWTDILNNARQPSE